MIRITDLRRCILPALMGLGLIGQGAAQERTIFDGAAQGQPDVQLASSISRQVIIARDVEDDESAAAERPDRQALPVRPGYPLPSVIVGHIDPAQSMLDRAPLDHDQRQQLKQQDPKAFARRLEAGDFDPDPDQIAEAIQTELSRMRCYAGRIDGLWGAATADGVQRYFSKAGGRAVTNSAQMVLFRQIVAGPDVQCDPLPVTTGPSANTRRTPVPARSGATPAARTAPTRAQPPRDQRQPTILPGFGGTGLFR